MGLCHGKLPGEWYGPHAIAVMLKDLNKLYRPFNNFQVCIFHDGNIYFDKIKRLATEKLLPDNEQEHPRYYLVKNAIVSKSKRGGLSKEDPYMWDDSKDKVNSNIEFIFKDYLMRIGHLKSVKVSKTGPSVGPHNAPSV